MIQLEEKIQWLRYLLTSVTFSRREISWMLDYLIHHEGIVKQIQFVEHAEKTPRGIRFVAGQHVDQPLSLFLDGRTFHDVDQIFHEIRFKWQEPLFVECILDAKTIPTRYLGLVEDNPYYRWNDQISQQDVEKVERSLKQLEWEQALKAIHEEINEALDQGDHARFQKASEELEQLRIQEADFF